MKIFINNKEIETVSTNLSALGQELSLPERGVAVAKSNCMVPRSEWSDTPICEGDNIVIIKAAYGG